MRFKKVLGILRTKIRLLLMIGVLLAAAAGCQFAGEYLHSHYIREEASETSGNISEKKTVVIDSGHGGKDPGKVGINGAQEKELNLQIAEKLKKYLEEHQITVVMTRTKDEDLQILRWKILKPDRVDRQRISCTCSLHSSEQLSTGKRKRTTDFLFCALEGGKESSRGNADRAEKFRSGACQRD